MVKVGIIDYEVGNIASIKNAVEYISKNIKIELVKKADNLKFYDKVILPGVGAFENAINLIRNKNFDEALLEESKKGKFILGICLGMQLLADKSYEGGEFEGLSFIKGEIVKFENIKVPHIGWNEVFIEKNDLIFKNIEDRSDFYFVHSYYFKCENSKNQIGSTEYGSYRFASVVKQDNVYGVQFHPEKSQKNGLILLKNFVEL